MGLKGRDFDHLLDKATMRQVLPQPTSSELKEGA
jgi:hypothetical protein